MKKLSSLSIFFPCYNDRYTIDKLVKQAYKTGRGIAKRLEVIVVDDGSTDSSRQVLKDLKKKFPSLKLVFHKHNEGYGGALKSGFKKATGSFVFYTDGDGQYDVKELTKLSAALQDGVDVVNGIKIKRQDPWLRLLASDIYYFWIKILFQTPIQEIDTDFRLIRRGKLNKVKLEMNSGAICVELISKLNRAGARFVEVPVRHYDRKFGRSQFFNPRRIVKTILDDLRLFWYLQHS